MHMQDHGFMFQEQVLPEETHISLERGDIIERKPVIKMITKLRGK